MCGVELSKKGFDHEDSEKLIKLIKKSAHFCLHHLLNTYFLLFRSAQEVN